MARRQPACHRRRTVAAAVTVSPSVSGTTVADIVIIASYPSICNQRGHSITFPYPGFDDSVTWHNVSFAGTRYQPALPSDGQPLYCWDGLGATTMIGSALQPPAPVAGVMLVQFESPTRIRFEYAATQTCATRSLTPAAQVFVR
jgi:hypothetical protein